jgi:hypothetical protein
LLIKMNWLCDANMPTKLHNKCCTLLCFTSQSISGNGIKYNNGLRHRFITYGPCAISTGLSHEIQWKRNNALKHKLTWFL